MTETDIIDHYVGEFLSEMAANDYVTDSSACHGEVGQIFWERIIVKCAHPNGGRAEWVMHD